MLKGSPTESPTTAYSLYAHRQRLQAAMHFAQDFNSTRALFMINRHINAPAILVLDTRVKNQLHEIEEENRGGDTTQSRCLNERARKVLGVFHAMAGIQFEGDLQITENDTPQHNVQLIQGQTEDFSEVQNINQVKKSTKVEKSQQSKLSRQRAQSPPRISQQINLLLAPPVRARKVQALFKTQQSEQSLCKSPNYRCSRSPQKNTCSQTQQTPMQSQPCQTITITPPLFQSPAAPPLYTRQLQDFKQNISISINESRNTQAGSSRQRPHLNFASGMLINIHEVLRARKESRSHDSDKTKKMEDFRARIETEMHLINQELKTLKDAKDLKHRNMAGYEQPRGDTETDQKIQELEQQIRRISLKSPRLPSPDTDTVTLKLDISAQCVSDIQHRKPKLIMADLSKSRTNKTARSTVRSVKGSRQTRVVKEPNKKIWRKADEPNSTSYVKALVHQKEMERKSLEKLKQSMTHAERKPLLSTRITQISRRQPEY